MASIKSIYIDPDKKKIDPILYGLWESKGYGRILEIMEDRVSLYHYTDSFCYRDPHERDFKLAESYSFFETLGEGTRLVLYRFDYGEKTEQYPNREDFVKVKALPENCALSLDRPEFSNPLFIFDLVWSTFNELYAFFKERGVDWDQVRQDYRPKISTETDAADLFGILAEILSKLNDGHIYLSWGDEHRFHGGTTRLKEDLTKAFEAQNEVDEFGEFTWKWYSSILDGISEKIIDGDLHKVANDKLFWGHINSDIGYLFLSHLTDFGHRGASKPEQLDILARELDILLEAFKDKKGIIIDLSHNQGGFDAAGHLVASRFADRERHVLNEYTRATDPGMARSHYVVPSKRGTYTGPIYLLTSEVTVSAGETLVLHLKAFPHVRHVGETTRGYLSGILNKPLPQGFHVTLSNEYWVPPSGEIYEGTGIKPEIGIEVFPASNLFGGHRHALAELVRLVEGDLGRK